MNEAEDIILLLLRYIPSQARLDQLPSSEITRGQVGEATKYLLESLWSSRERGSLNFCRSCRYYPTIADCPDSTRPLPGGATWKEKFGEKMV